MFEKTEDQILDEVYKAFPGRELIRVLVVMSLQNGVCKIFPIKKVKDSSKIISNIELITHESNKKEI